MSDGMRWTDGEEKVSRAVRGETHLEHNCACAVPKAAWRYLILIVTSGTSACWVLASKGVDYRRVSTMGELPRPIRAVVMM